MPYVENRVTVAEFGMRSANSPLLVDVPTAPGHPQQRNHVVMAGYLATMSAAAGVALGSPLVVASGWRVRLAGSHGTEWSATVVNRNDRRDD